MQGDLDIRIYIFASFAGFDEDAHAWGWRRVDRARGLYRTAEGHVARRISRADQLRGVEGEGCFFMVGHVPDGEMWRYQIEGVREVALLMGMVERK